jgi:hypothetical protein
MASSAERYRITLLEFTGSFVPFALLLGAALLAAETSMDLGLSRAVYTIWATTALVTPALCAFALPGESSAKQNIWILFWTFAFIVYLVHVYYALFWVYHGSFREFLDGQGIFPAVNNVIFTAWWAFDLVLAWFRPSSADWVRKQRIGAHIYIGGVFAISTVILKHGFINVLGGLLTASIIVCLLIRWDYARSLRAEARSVRAEALKSGPRPGSQ